ncbi:MAG: pyruvate, phosphate dikinase [Spirochaetes bacterium]|nr:MAG: pyruvate, phosphate dikinase [Spirochaetota bacterium]RKX98141.1 MAG: pyruvate, phosphate dikinase [Spirochaetota bacterium]
MKEIFSFSSSEFTEDEDIIQHFGMRGQNLMGLASMGIPILPGFILTEDFLAEDSEEHEEHIARYQKAFAKMGGILEKDWDEDNPLLVKLVVSPMLNMVHTFSSIHNIGLCDTTIGGFSGFVGEDFAYHEYRGVVLRIMELELLTTTDNTRRNLLEKTLEELRKAKKTPQIKKAIDSVRAIFPQEIFAHAGDQFFYIKELFLKLFAASETLSDSAILVQAMTFGNYGKESFFGSYTTRDSISGKDVLTGDFFPNSFDATQADGQSISKISKTYLDKLKKIGKQLEISYKEIRNIKFNVENGKLWIIDQSSVPGKSAQAEIQTLLDLLRDKHVEETYVINSIQPGRLSEILHPIIDKRSANRIPSHTGGISGAMGAAIGRVFFTTEALMKEYRIASQRNLDNNLILAMPATYAGDVKAIEAANGVLTREGGYASHAPVVARSLGKVAMVNPDIVFSKTGLKIGNKIVKEGDYISLDVPSYDDPVVYFGKLVLIEPDIDKSGLLDFLEVVQTHIGDFDVHANADQPSDAKLARKFLADGIGLCRTEHMFFNENRIPIFRSLIIAPDRSEREKILKKIKKMQVSDFYGLFEVMGERTVTIRLLDAPLHEFLPHSKDSMDAFVAFYRKNHPKVSESEIRLRCDMTSEVNPMLGHRGVRVAISYPEIYRMQVEAIFEAAYKLRKEKGVVCRPEIMIPVIMSPREVKTIRFGKRIEGFEIVGVRQIAEELREKLGEETIDYKVGTMIELPAAALLADKIARYADFFSFGTNDLTQTCLGLSRDDFNSFFTDYNEYDLLDKNPFQYLQEPVKELVGMAVERGRVVKPDLTCGLCGEHGAEPENIPFCMDAGLNYVSCSPYGIPLAKLSIAQKNIKDLATG